MYFRVLSWIPYSLQNLSTNRDVVGSSSLLPSEFDFDDVFEQFEISEWIALRVLVSQLKLKNRNFWKRQTEESSFFLFQIVSGGRYVHFILRFQSSNNYKISPASVFYLRLKSDFGSFTSTPWGPAFNYNSCWKKDYSIFLKFTPHNHLLWQTIYLSQIVAPTKRVDQSKIKDLLLSLYDCTIEDSTLIKTMFVVQIHLMLSIIGYVLIHFPELKPLMLRLPNAASFLEKVLYLADLSLTVVPI